VRLTDLFGLRGIRAGLLRVCQSVRSMAVVGWWKYPGDIDMARLDPRRPCRSLCARISGPLSWSRWLQIERCSWFLVSGIFNVSGGRRQTRPQCDRPPPTTFTRYRATALLFLRQSYIMKLPWVLSSSSSTPFSLIVRLLSPAWSSVKGLAMLLMFSISLPSLD
jgi:hypothetical protein